MNQIQNYRREIEPLSYQSIVRLQQIHNRECSVCYIQQQLISFAACNHSFCQKCLYQHLSFSLKRYTIPKCPQDTCSLLLTQNSNAFGLLDEEQRRIYSKIINYHKIIKNPNYLPCQRQSCFGFIDKTLLQHYCSQCGQPHCHNCYQLIHQGQCITKVAIELQSQQKFRQCFKCGQIIQKSQGCSHMSCTCGHYFCYCCGQTLGVQEHQCIVPSELNYLQQVRWSIEHQQLWYQLNNINFLKYLLCVSLSRQCHPVIKVLWSFVYFILVYPLSLAIFIALCLLAVVVLLTIFIIFSIFIPFLALTSHQPYWPTFTIRQQFGMLIALISVLLFYPILYLVNLVQFFAFVPNEEFEEALWFISTHLLKGIRNMGLIPCLMMIDNEDYYLGLGKLRQQRLHREQLQEIF